MTRYLELVESGLARRNFSSVRMLQHEQTMGSAPTAYVCYGWKAAVGAGPTSL
jgi:hypothetical protein